MSAGNTQAPERIGPYRLVRKIGEGGMGVVHLGLDEDGREVAIKVLHPHVAADLKARDRLIREVETMRRVRSPFVASVLDAELVGREPYVVTRFAPGRTLEDIVLSDGPLGAREVIRLAQGLCQALVAIHAADVIHRDLKPSNVMMVNGEPLVIDFGIAHLVNATRLTQTGMFVGTPGYLAPEIIRDAEITQKADVHALASTVFFAAAGVPPFGTGAFEVICYNIMEGRPQLDKAPVWLRGWLARALAVDPDERPTAQELLRMARALDPRVTTFNEVPPPNRSTPSGTKVLPSKQTYSDLLPPVEYGRPAPEPPRTRRQPEVKPPPYVPAPMSARPVAPPPRPDQRVAGYPAPPYTPPAYTPPRQRKKYVVGSQLVGGLLLAALVGLTVMMPVVMSVVGITLALVLRMGEYLFGDLVKRRQARGGASAADPLLVVVGTPWALVKSFLITLVHVPLALLFGLCVYGVARWGGGFDTNQAIAYAAGGLVAGLFVLPGGGAPRKAVARTLTSVLRTPGAALVAALVAGTAAVIVVMFALGQEPTWEPWRAPSTVLKELTDNARDSATGLVTGMIDDLMRSLGLGFLSPWGP
ncbi:serine/threonine-protein kinase [Thermoactinospora rubra]|uniref:serine/threonine-protein kinase n=1 Tax=Thermoactinospora rubra TaxID=1088767 RepID=UPI000A11FCA9|nr:serine/threonine-protein kinase [Thermoactinospora rubra]